MPKFGKIGKNDKKVDMALVFSVNLSWIFSNCLFFTKRA